MSTYIKTTKNPNTGEWEQAEWRDDYFGKHHYGVIFPNGDIFDPEIYKLETRDDGTELVNSGLAIHSDCQSSDRESCWEQIHNKIRQDTREGTYKDLKTIAKATGNEEMLKLLDNYFA